MPGFDIKNLFQLPHIIKLPELVSPSKNIQKEIKKYLHFSGYVFEKNLEKIQKHIWIFWGDIFVDTFFDIFFHFYFTKKSRFFGDFFLDKNMRRKRPMAIFCAVKMEKTIQTKKNSKKNII